MKRDYLRSLTIFLLFFLLWSVHILQTLRVKEYTNRFLSILRFILPYLVDFPYLYCCHIRLQVFITLYRSNSRSSNSVNFMQLQAMRTLALNFRFVLVFDNSRIGMQFRNKLNLCKENIALRTILSLRLCIAPAPIYLLCTLYFCYLDKGCIPSISWWSIIDIKVWLKLSVCAARFAFSWVYIWFAQSRLLTICKSKYYVQTSRTCVKDNESSIEFFERKSQTDIRFIKVEGRYSAIKGAYVRKGVGGV